MRFSVAFHHGGNFVRDWIICYKGGDKAIFKVKDDDDWGFAEMCSLVEDDLKVSKGYRLWWMHDEDINFRLVRLDEDVYAVKDYAVSNNCVANIYVEHDVGETSGLVDVPNFINTTQGCDSSQVIDTEKGKNVVVASDNEKDDDIAEDDDDFSSSEDEAKGVTFDDSEDERGLGLEDGFEVPYAEPKNGTNRVIIEEDIGSEKRWVFISDQQKGLMQVFDEMSLRVEHRLCLRHLYANFKKKFGGGTLIRDLMMGAAKATYIQAWQVKMNELKKADLKAWEWLSNVPTKLWLARDKPILTMLYKRAPGRPKKLRRRGGDEPRPGKWSRRVHGDGPINRCTTCNGEGHNAKSCKIKTIDPEAAKRKRKPKRKAQAQVSEAVPQAISEASVPVENEASVPDNEAAVPVNEPVQAAVDVNEPVQAAVDVNEPVPTQVPVNEPVQAAVDVNEPVQAAVDVNEPVPTQVPVNEPVQAAVDVNEPVQAAVDVNEPVPTQVPVNEPVPTQAQHVSQDEPEPLSKKKRVNGQFKQPAQANHVNPKPVNTKPVNPKPVNPKPKPPLIIKPSAHIKTNVNTVFKNPTHVKTPSGSMVINPTANVTTCVKPYPSAKTVIKPSAHVNTFFKTYGPTNIVVNPNANVDTVVKPFIPVKPSEMRKIKQEKIEKAKVDLTKVRRSGRIIMKTNCNGPGKDKDCL
ncbi:hypothetical protein P8452_50574 [Trifolium repens]|nr:hypothetical protein P8452_50574 [Trifolium repens]